MFDLVVIGGNLAGTTAAITAVSKCSNVALIEKNKEPFNPAHCGELIPSYTADILNLDKMDCFKNEIKNMKIKVPPKEYNLKLKNKMIIFDRNCVENKLLNEAEKKGVTVMLGTKMKDFRPPYEIYLNNNKSIKGKVIIDASGITCQVGKRIGINTKLKPMDVGVCIQSRVQSNYCEGTMELHFHKPYAPFGYAWLFPLNNTFANIGIIVPGGQKLDISKLLSCYIKDSSREKLTIINTFRAYEPIALPLNELYKNNVMIVGDAARLVYPESGGGIDSALVSGRLAGITAARYINGEINSLKPYQQALRVRILRVKNGYNRKIRASKSDKKYIKTYQRIFLFLSIANRIFPSLLNSPWTGKY